MGIIRCQILWNGHQQQLPSMPDALMPFVLVGCSAITYLCKLRATHVKYAFQSRSQREEEQAKILI